MGVVIDDKDLIAVMKWHLSSVESLLSLYRHDLKNKLAILSGQAQLLERVLKGGPTTRLTPAELLQKMLQAVEQMNAMLANLGKSGFDFVQEESKIWSIQNLVESAWHTTEHQVRAASLFTWTNKIPDNVSLKIKKSPVEYALLQLIRNSVQHSKAQTERWVRAEAVQKKNQWVIQIVDSGSGVDPLVLPLLFSAFVAHPKGQGHLGLGLSTARLLMESIGGGLHHVEGTPNTTFELLLPA